MKELSKSISRRLKDNRFLTRYFVGKGIDIGGKPDPLELYQELFPMISEVMTWDLEDGDAQFMQEVLPETYDFVHSSHCLEHVVDPDIGLKNWIRILKPGGFLIVMVPDEDLYEQGVFPSNYNLDHKHTFTANKSNSWSTNSKNLIDLVSSLGNEAQLEKLELLNSTYRYDLPRFDQTCTPVGECGIELIMRKVDKSELEAGVLKRSSKQPPERLRVHYNQYRDDYRQMKKGNLKTDPFTNTKEL